MSGGYGRAMSGVFIDGVWLGMKRALCRFYIAFENSVCTDYVTEKFLKANYWTVPIVLKGSIYRHIAPPNSYIAVDSFATIKEYIDHLQNLKQNTTAYMEYFRWRQHYELYEPPVYFRFCELCEKLLNASDPIKIWHNIPDWYTGHGVCENDYARNLV
jgi:alpha-1,3-fucosyltransferase